MDCMDPMDWSDLADWRKEMDRIYRIDRLGGAGIALISMKWGFF